ncbi:hypothetical protein RvY_08002 [Ramazzottius varieornatus]|uniref:INTS8 TPR repeats domain-containing protein n=1 Tax=Ramazzottius varieornatus TaxID=947166 RepID=A0A1D1V483_RAMVA|nr:hypothetical protein RvY_08002 [Ramazzottius varieornatus]
MLGQYEPFIYFDKFSIISNSNVIPSLADFGVSRKLIQKCANGTDPTLPSVSKLIDLTLRQNLDNPQEVYQRLPRCSRVDVDERLFLTTRRVRAAKTVTLMLASAIKWDLEKLESEMAITMQFCLVQDFMNKTFSTTKYCSSVSDPQNISERFLSSFTYEILNNLQDECVFGLSVYARWILRAHIQRKLPKKSTKGPPIHNIGSVTDPDVLQGLDQQQHGSSLIWALFRQISRDKVAQTAITLLNDIEKLDRKEMMVPTADCFVITSNETVSPNEHRNTWEVVEDDWSKGVIVDFLEYRTQILCDVAGYFLFEGKIAEAADYLQRATVLLSQKPVSSFQYCNLTVDVIDKMCRVVNVPSPFPPVSSSLTFVPDLTPSMKSKHIEALLEDLPSGKISSTARYTLENEIQSSSDSSERTFLTKVRFCNLLRDYVAGTSCPSFMELRKLLNEATSAELEWLRGILNGYRISKELKLTVCAKLKFLADRDLVSNIAKTKLADTINFTPPHNSSQTQEEPTDVEMTDVKDIKEEITPADKNRVLAALNSAVSFRQIHTAVEAIPNISPTVTLKEMESEYLKNIPPTLESSYNKALWNQTMTDLVIVSFAKAAKFAESFHFRAARQILKDIRAQWQTFPKLDAKIEKKLEKNWKWQSLYADLWESQHHLSLRSCTKEMKAEANRRAMVCSKALMFKAPDDEPVPSYVLDLAVLILFNLEEWDYINEPTFASNFDQRKKIGTLPLVFPLLKQLIQACREFTSQREDLISMSKGERPRQPKLNYQHCLKLWNMIASVLSKADPLPPSKKPGSSTSIFSVDGKAFWSVMRLIQHRNVLYLVLSCVCRMWSLTNKGPTTLAMSADPLWPSTLPLQSPVSAGDIKEAVESVMEISYAAGVDDPEASVVKGNFYFASGRYEEAMKMFLLSVVPDSLPGFIHPPTGPSLSQAVLRKMASTLEAMKCFTYLAVLCQMMQPVDYETAFRAVSEKVTYDSADAAYQFIWDPLILEHTAYVMQKAGFLEKRQVVLDVLQDPLLTGANPPAVGERIAAERSAEFFEVLFTQYVLGN